MVRPVGIESRLDILAADLHCRDDDNSVALEAISVIRDLRAEVVRMAECLHRLGVEDVAVLTPDEAGQIFEQWQVDWKQAAQDSADLYNLRRKIGLETQG